MVGWGLHPPKMSTMSASNDSGRQADVQDEVTPAMLLAGALVVESLFPVVSREWAERHALDVYAAMSLQRHAQHATNQSDDHPPSKGS